LLDLLALVKCILVFLFTLKGKQVPAVTTVDLTEEEPAKPPLPSLPQDVTAQEIPTGTINIS